MCACFWRVTVLVGETVCVLLKLCDLTGLVRTLTHSLFGGDEEEEAEAEQEAEEEGEGEGEGEEEAGFGDMRGGDR